MSRETKPLSLNEQISLLVEPRPTKKPHRIRELPDGITAWWFDWIVEQWLPIDWLHDEAASAMLLDGFLAAGFAAELWPQASDPRIIVIFRRVIGVGAAEEYGRGHLCADRKEAIALAFLAWKGKA